MAKAQADIEIAVRGINQLKEARNNTTQLSKEINKLTRDAAKDVFGKLPKNSKSLVKSTNNLNQVLSDARSNFNKAAVGTDVARKAAINLVDAEEEVNKTLREQNKLLEQVRKKKGTGGIRGALFGQGEEQVQRRRQAISSGAIGGAFPLLFGQGGGAAVGGALGGAAGGLMGGQFGFALSLVGTQIGSAVDSFVKGAASVGQALNPLTADLDSLVSSLGITGTAEAQRIKLIEQAQGKQAALNAVTAQMNQVLGADAVESLKRFGETSRLIGNNFSQALLKLQGALAPVLETIANFVAKSTGAEQGEIDRLSKSRVGTDPEVVALQRQIKELENTKGASRSGAIQGQIANLKAELEARKKILADLKKEDILASNKNKKLDIALDKLESENKLLNAKKEGREKEFMAQQQIAEILKQIEETGKTLTDEQMKRIEGAVMNNQKLKEEVETANQLKEAFKSISDTVKNDIKQGIKGLIQGTSTLSDLLNNVADRFLSLAIDTMFDGPTGGGGIFGFLGGLFKAKGGPVTGGNPYIVGEKGPELFVPGSSGNIVPNNKLGGSGGGSGVGGNNIVVNVDASGSKVQGDEEEGRELGRMIAVAIQSEIIKQKRPGGLL